MKGMDRVAFYVFVSLLVFGIGAPVSAGPMMPIVDENEEKKLSNSEAKEELQQLQEETQKNIEKEEQIRREEKQQESALKDISHKLQEIEKRLPS